MKRPKTIETNATYIYNFLMKEINNKIGVCALMGNLKAESGLSSINLENTFNKKLGLSDIEFTDKVDNGEIDFIKECKGGYGLAQWTYHTRKKKLLQYAIDTDSSIGNMDMQLEFLISELKTNYKSLYKNICNAKDMLPISNEILFIYENPADKSEKVQVSRFNNAMYYYNNLADVSRETTAQKIIRYQVTTPKGLYVRTEPSTTGKIITCMSYAQVFNIVSITNGWGYIPELKGYTCLDFARKV